MKKIFVLLFATSMLFLYTSAQVQFVRLNEFHFIDTNNIVRIDSKLCYQTRIATLFLHVGNVVKKNDLVKFIEGNSVAYDVAISWDFLKDSIPCVANLPTYTKIANLLVNITDFNLKKVWRRKLNGKFFVLVIKNTETIPL